VSTPAARGAGVHLPGLDGLRGAAALVVVVGHAFAALFVNTHVGVVVALGIPARGAVILFFVLSGFVIAGSIRADLAAGGFSFIRFGLNRMTRIYPPFLLALVLAWSVAALRQEDLIRSVQPFVAEPMNLSAINFLRDALFLYGSGTPMQNANAPVWSLRIEVVCYLVSALLALAATAPGLPRAAALAAALVLTAAAILRLDSAILGFAAFAAGAFAAFVPRLRNAAPLALGGALALALMAFASISALVAEDPVSIVRGLLFHVFQAATICASALLVASASDERSGAARWAARLAPLAPFSYTLFITHVPLIALTLGVFPEPAAIWARIIAAISMVAWAVAFAAAGGALVEQHQKLRRWLAARPPFDGLLAWDRRR